jgi:hypothetical protein
MIRYLYIHEIEIVKFGDGTVEMDPQFGDGTVEIDPQSGGGRRHCKYKNTNK